MKNNLIFFFFITIPIIIMIVEFNISKEKNSRYNTKDVFKIFLKAKHPNSPNYFIVKRLVINTFNIVLMVFLC